jgi:hypothetical protein
LGVAVDNIPRPRVTIITPPSQVTTASPRTKLAQFKRQIADLLAQKNALGARESGLIDTTEIRQNQDLQYDITLQIDKLKQQIKDLELALQSVAVVTNAPTTPQIPQTTQTTKPASKPPIPTESTLRFLQSLEPPAIRKRKEPTASEKVSPPPPSKRTKVVGAGTVVSSPPLSLSLPRSSASATTPFSANRLPLIVHNQSFILETVPTITKIEDIQQLPLPPIKEADVLDDIVQLRKLATQSQGSLQQATIYYLNIDILPQNMTVAKYGPFVSEIRSQNLAVVLWTQHELDKSSYAVAGQSEINLMQAVDNVVNDLATTSTTTTNDPIKIKLEWMPINNEGTIFYLITVQQLSSAPLSLLENDILGQQFQQWAHTYYPLRSPGILLEDERVLHQFLCFWNNVLIWRWSTLLGMTLNPKTHIPIVPIRIETICSGFVGSSAAKDNVVYATAVWKVVLNSNQQELIQDLFYKDVSAIMSSPTISPSSSPSTQTAEETLARTLRDAIDKLGFPGEIVTRVFTLSEDDPPRIAFTNVVCSGTTSTMCISKIVQLYEIADKLGFAVDLDYSTMLFSGGTAVAKRDTPLSWREWFEKVQQQPQQ